MVVLAGEVKRLRSELESSNRRADDFEKANATLMQGVGAAGGMASSAAKAAQEISHENLRLKQELADLSAAHSMLRNGMARLHIRMDSTEKELQRHRTKMGHVKKYVANAFTALNSPTLTGDRCDSPASSSGD